MRLKMPVTVSFGGLEIARVVKNLCMRLEMKPEPILGLNEAQMRKSFSSMSCSRSSRC